MPRREHDRASLPRVLRRELQWIRGWRLPRESGGPRDADALRAVYRMIAEQTRAPPLSALCLSGGGIRSASFNLGVLQALARAGILASFDYLSTVSGGGYVGCWLQAWIAAERAAKAPDPIGKVSESLRGPGRREGDGAAGRVAAVDDPVRPEPKPIDRLREFSNYLTPRKGLFSGDTWVLVAIVLRNLLLNWLVVVPVVAALLIVPQTAYVILASRGYGAVFGGRWVAATSWAAILLAFVSSVATHWKRAERRGRSFSAERVVRAEERKQEQRRRQAFTIVTACGSLASATLFVLAALWSHHPWEVLPAPGSWGDPTGVWDRAARALVWTVGLPIAGDLVARAGRLMSPGEWPPLRALIRELVALAASGATAALALAWLMGGTWDFLVDRPHLLTVLGLPLLLVAYVLARALFVAIAGRDEGSASETIGDDADREWWARMTGRLLMAAAAWAAASGLALLGTWILADNWGRAYEGLHSALGWMAAAGGGVAGALVGRLGVSAETTSGRGGGASSGWKELVLALAAPLAVVCVLVLVAAGTTWLGRLVNDIQDECFLLVPPLRECKTQEPDALQLARFLGVGLGLVLFGLLAGCFVNVNRFSLHAMYRNRLVRAYLGASNTDRRPNSITGFDPEDAALHLAGVRGARGRARLFPIVNVTLNLLRDERLAMQQRQAESFSMTPLYCGNFYEGYRRTKEYGGEGGVTLATAMAVSGAAANPNMGYVSSPALTFLMGLLNARLGIWLANPNENGRKVVGREGPRHATSHLFRELLGATTRYAAYVNLSDGGHFDNLGLYEVVLRRCRLVVVSDAGCDAKHRFGDLGEAIRKIRIDFGIDIRFEKEIGIRPRKEDGGLPDEGSYCAVATIRYSTVDGTPPAADGTLIYVKPTLASYRGETVPYDVQAYAGTSEAFPHESTVDQWFSESQLESYRALGVFLVGKLAGNEPLPDLAEFEERARKHAGVPRGRAPDPH